MIYKKFQSFEQELPVLGLGCWGLSGGNFWTDSDDKELIATVETAVDQGITFFDVAPVYGFGHAEEILGKGLKGNRDKVIVASKCGMVWNEKKNISLDLSRESILREIDLSLKRLNMDYLDLYQLHWPDKDVCAPIEESLDTLFELKKAGKIRNIGLTNFSKEDLSLAVEKYEIASYQGLYNMCEHNPTFYHAISLDYRSQKEILPMCREAGIPFLPYSPLMQGLLTSHFDPAEWGDGDVRILNPKFHGKYWLQYKNLAEKIQAFANEVNRPISQVAINWLVAQSEIGPVISGGTKPEHILENVKACEWYLSEEEWKTLNSMIQEGVALIEREMQF